MNLLNYYQKRGTSCDVLNDAELRQDISNLLGIAVMLEGPGFRSAEEQEKILAENHDKFIGFAYYLLDYQGVHDKIFATQARLFSIFAGMIFLRNIPFANAEHRLLEISQKFELATLHPEKEKTQSFIDRIVYGILVQKRGQTVPPPYVLWYLDTDSADSKNS